MPITIVEAIKGATVEVPTLSGSKRIRVPAGTQHGTVQRLRGEGPPRLERQGARRHPLPARHRGAAHALEGAERGRRRARAGDERQPARAAVHAGGRADGDAPRRGHPVYMISVAAELAGMHPQTLRIYEQRGLIEPNRSPKGTRLYSQEDVERLRRIQELTTQLGMNLAGVERVFELEGELEQMRRRMDRLERRAEQMREEFEDEVDARPRASFRVRARARTSRREQALMPRRETPSASAYGGRERRRCRPTASRSSPRRRSPRRRSSRPRRATRRCTRSTCSSACSSRRAASSCRSCGARTPTRRPSAAGRTSARRAARRQRRRDAGARRSTSA